MDIESCGTFIPHQPLFVISGQKLRLYRDQSPLRNSRPCSDLHLPTLETSIAQSRSGLFTLGLKVDGIVTGVSKHQGPRGTEYGPQMIGSPIDGLQNRTPPCIFRSFHMPAPAKCPKPWPDSLKIESIGSIGSMILGILEVLALRALGFSPKTLLGGWTSKVPRTRAFRRQTLDVGMEALMLGTFEVLGQAEYIGCLVSCP